MLIARHHDRLTRNPDDFARLMQVCGKAKIKISLYTGGELDLHRERRLLRLHGDRQVLVRVSHQEPAREGRS